MAKVLRILNMGVNSHKKIFPITVYNTLILAIKESIILSNYENFRKKDGSISANNMSKTERFRLAFVDRQTIIRTFKKNNIEYKSKQ